MHLLSLLIYHRESIACRSRESRFSLLIAALLFLPLPLSLLLVLSAELRMKRGTQETISVTRQTNQQTDRVAYRVACSRLKIYHAVIEKTAVSASSMILAFSKQIQKKYSSDFS